MRAILFCLAFWMTMAGGWILLTFSADYQEAVAASSVGIVVTTFAVAVRGWSRAKFTAPRGWEGPVASTLPKIVKDTGLLMTGLYMTLTRRVRLMGRYVRIPFDPGGSDPESAGRRAIVMAGISITPNTVVMDIEFEKQDILVHELLPSSPPLENRDRKWPL